MTRFGYLMKELWRTLYRHPGTVLGSLLSLTLLYLLFDVFWLAAGSTNRYYAQLLSDVRMEVYLKEDVTDSTLMETARAVDEVPGVLSVEFVSKEEARQELANLIGTDLLVGYDSLNPLPRSFVFTVKPEYRNLVSLSGMEQQLLTIPGVLEVHYSRQWLERMEKTRSLFRTVGLFLGVIVLLTAIITSANSIRLMTRARAVGLHQMLLLGSGKLFAAFPFIAEGFAIGGVSAIVSWLIVFYGRQKVDFSQFELVIPQIGDIALFCLAAALLGMVSGYLGIRRLLR